MCCALAGKIARVVKLADTLALGASSLKGLRVRVPPLAPDEWMVCCGSNSVVEYNLAKVGVAGSNPVFRSRNG